MNIHNVLNKKRLGSKYWVNSENKTFSELCEDNVLLPQKWKNSKDLLTTDHAKKILKPANEYARIFSYKPEIIKEEDKIVLRYKTHAEIWFEEKPDGLYALDKVMQRQFYPSELDVVAESKSFDAIYKFYIPWILDIDKIFSVKPIKSSPFFIYNDTVNFNRIDPDKKIWDVGFIHFSIKKIGDHVRKFDEDVFGIIDVETPICDIIIEDQQLANWIINE
jgi:hypothetical protein